MGSIWRLFRDFLFSRTNKELLIFVFFIALSGIFWLSMTLNETYEQEFSIPVTVVGVPKNVVLTSEETDTIRMTIRDKGITLAAYMYGDMLKNVKINFKPYAHSNGTGIVTTSELQKIVYQHLVSSSKIISTKPDKLEFFYNYGANKRVPVRWTGRVIPEDLYFISRVKYYPDSVDVYASQTLLDSISVVYSEHLNYVNFRDTLVVNANLEKIKGVKMVPDHIKMEFFTDVLTEEKLDGIPVEGINMPPGKILRTFPMKVTVSFVTGVSVYRSLKPEDFTIVADYDEIAAKPSEKCRIYIKKSPSGISRVHLNINEVDYLIEEQVE
ncbi:MAG: YbbR-like domain-containing protein [Prevotella sp.]|nr:YbbR-like domain-containing protein [Prevotella sp.]MBR1768664.1 YbbR-like domain-containing protein [Prevotella sp.]